MKFDGVALALVVGALLLIYFGLKIRKYNSDYVAGYNHALNMDAICIDEKHLIEVKSRYRSDKAFDRGFRSYFSGESE